MRWAEGFIAVDWGTTNRRAYLIGGDGSRLDEMEDDRGILSIPKGGFPAAVDAIRAHLGDRPMLMAGMVGSNRGWAEAPYIPCPAGLEEISAALWWVEADRIAIVPGLSWTSRDEADVMRGEEVQILGAVAEQLIPPDGVLCHPGTHNKWIRLEGGRIAAFRTIMTGEIFNLLREHSILADLLRYPVTAGASFAAGVRRGFEEDALLAEIFAVRARTLLGKAAPEDAASYTSGLLIGSDLRTGLRFAGQSDLVVIGRPELTSLFAFALGTVGRSGRELDGEQAFLGGAVHLAELVK